MANWAELSQSLTTLIETTWACEYIQFQKTSVQVSITYRLLHIPQQFQNFKEMLLIKKTNWFKYLPYSYKLLLCDTCQSLLSRKQIKIFEGNLYNKRSFCFSKSCNSNQTEVDTWVRKWIAANFMFEWPCIFD